MRLVVVVVLLALVCEPVVGQEIDLAPTTKAGMALMKLRLQRLQQRGGPAQQARDSLLGGQTLLQDDCNAAMSVWQSLIVFLLGIAALARVYVVTPDLHVDASKLPGLLTLFPHLKNSRVDKPLRVDHENYGSDRIARRDFLDGVLEEGFTHHEAVTLYNHLATGSRLDIVPALQQKFKAHREDLDGVLSDLGIDPEIHPASLPEAH